MSRYEADVVRECLSFLSSATEFSTRGQHLLLRCLQLNRPAERQTFFKEVSLSVRREGTGHLSVLAALVTVLLARLVWVGRCPHPCSH